MKDNGSIPWRSTSCRTAAKVPRVQLRRRQCAGRLDIGAAFPNPRGGLRYASSCAVSVLPDFAQRLVVLGIGRGQAAISAEQWSPQDNRSAIRRRVDAHVAGAHIDKTLPCVGEFDDVLEFEDSRRSLDGVGRAKHGVERLRVVWRLFKAQQRVLHRIEQFAAFRHECLKAGLHFHYCFPSLMATTSPKYAASR